MAKRKRKYTKRGVMISELVPAVPAGRQALAALVRSEPNDRRRRFLVTLVEVLHHLSPDDLDVIEPRLYQALGRAAVGKAVRGL